MDGSPHPAPRAGAGLGLRSTRPIDKDGILAVIPSSTHLTARLPELLASAAAAAGLDALGRLALRLAHERALGDDSTFAPYINVLPEREKMQLPLLWAEEEVELLNPSPVYDDITEASPKTPAHVAALISSRGSVD